MYKVKKLHILLWSIAILYLLFSPYLSYHIFVREGRALDVWKQPPLQTGGVRYNVEDLKYWSKNIAVYEEGEIYALFGWAFLDGNKDIALTEFSRFIILSSKKDSYIFTAQVYTRPDVKDVFKDLGLVNLSSAGFFSIIAKNALPLGVYDIGLLFKHEQSGEEYYIKTSNDLVRTPNHLRLDN